MQNKQQRPDWIKSWVNDDFEQTIEKNIEAAEKKCALDFFPALVQESTSFGHIFPILSLIFLSIYILTLPILALPFNGWLLLAIHTVVFVVILVLAQALSDVPWIKRNLTSQEDQNISVDIAAKLTYFENNIHVHDSILIYISLVEHKILLLCNEKVMAKIDQSILNQAVHVCSQDLKQGNLQDAIEHCLMTLSDQLKDIFPTKGQAANRLKNQAILKNSAKPKK